MRQIAGNPLVRLDLRLQATAMANKLDPHTLGSVFDPLFTGR